MARKRNKRTTSEQYWKRRTDELEQKWSEKSKREIERELKDYYQQALEHIQKNVNDLYARFAKENGLDMVAAQRLLQGKEFRTWRMDMKEYLAQIEATGNPALLRELNTLAMRSRISRLDKLYGETLVECVRLAEKTGQSLDRFLPSAYKDFYYRNLYGIAKEGALRNTVSQVDPQRIEDVLRVPWSGKNYSQRIWKNNEELAKSIQKITVQSMHRGASVQELSQTIAQKMSVGYNDAERLVRTELNYVENQAALDSIKDAGFDFYEFLATLDNRTSPQCREHDGTIFPVEDAQPGENMPPLHPRCRSTIVASFGEGMDNKRGTRIARNAAGRNIHVPADMKYSDWKAVYVDKTQTMKEWRKEHSAAASALAKNIDLEDFKIAGSSQGISDDVLDTIRSTLIKMNDDSRRIYFDDFEFSSPEDSDGRTVVFQTRPDPPLNRSSITLVVNKDYFAGKTLEQLNKAIKADKAIVAQNLEEMVIHECGHCQLIRGLSEKEIKKLYAKLEKIHIDGVSDTAFKDGAECIAETKVLIVKGRKVPKEAKDLFDQYIKE